MTEIFLYAGILTVYELVVFWVASYSTNFRMECIADVLKFLYVIFLLNAFGLGALARL